MPAAAPAADAAAAAPPRQFNEKLAAQVEQLVLKRIESDTLELPTLPAVALRCLEILKKPDFTFAQVAALLEQDPLLAARTMRMATSAAFAAGTKTLSTTEALTRLGARTVKTLLVEASAAKVFTSRNAQIAQAARRLWQHSVAVAGLARDLSAVNGGSDSEAAYLAGLLHDVGKPIVAAVLLEAERQIAELRSERWIESAEWVWVVKRTHRRVGVALTEKWQLPPAVSRCVRDCSEYDPSDRPAISNAVCFCNALAKINGLEADDSDLEDARALVMIGRSLLGIEDAVVNPVVAQLKQKIANLYD